MIRSANISKEIVVTAENKVGVLADISKILADHGINIEGVAGYEIGNEAKIMIVAEDTLRAKEALERAGYKKMTEHEIVIVDLENKPGALKSITAKMAAEKIDIKYIYGSSCPEGCPAKIVLSTSNNEKALVLFRAK